MSLYQELLDLYLKNEDKAGKYERGRFGEPLILIPVFHTTVKAQITVAVNTAGKFLYARVVPEEDNLTLIPVTEKSAARTTRPEPQPLCDNLKYLAGDYMDYVVPEKKKDFRENYRLYMEELGKWAESPYTHEKVRAIRNYLSQSSLMQDLIAQGILKTNGQGRVLPKEKIQKIEQTECFVRFRVENTETAEQGLLGGEMSPPECWRDRTLQEAYINYVKSQDLPKGISYLSGEYEALSFLHPKKIRNEGDGAKLFSANDESNYTFRGRFASKEEAFSIGYEDSQKIHSALKWIIRNQGKSWNGLTVVTWESDLKKLPEWDVDTDRLCEVYRSSTGWDDEEEDNGIAYEGTNPRAANRVIKAIDGYGSKLEINSRMVFLALDAATTGRLSLMEYQSMDSSAYLENLKRWHKDCGWIQIKFKDKTYYEYFGVVSIRDIANLLYGVESGAEMSLKGTNEKLYAEVCKRLIPCILTGRNIPEDMVRQAQRRASSPLFFEKSYHWDQVLALACSFTKKRNCERGKKEEWTVALNKERDDRSYLFGRLLAVADQIESKTMESGEERVTNAKRYMNMFSQQPFRTWKVLEERLQPYINKLFRQDRIYLENLIDEIKWKFKDGEFESRDALNGNYLLGFHNQRYVFFHKVEEDKEDE